MSLDQPDFNSSEDQKLYNILFYQNNFGRPLTEQEKQFVTKMYHMEEYASGLDGD